MGGAMQQALRYRWLIFWILAAGYVLVYFHRLCPAVVAVDMMTDLKAGGTLLGILGSAYFYPYAAMQLPAGLLADSWGPRRTITVFLILAFGGSLLLGLAPSLVWAVVGRAFVGIGVSMLFVPAMKILAEWFRAAEYARMTGILMAMGGVGSLSAATPLAGLSAAIGWRFSFVVVGVLTLALAAAIWTVVRDKPADMGWESPVEARAKGPAIGLTEGIGKVIRARFFWPLALWFFFTCAIFFAYGGLWGGPYLIQIAQLTKVQAGRVLSMLAVGMIIGSPALSHVSDRVFGGRKPVMVMSAAVLVVLVSILAFATDKIPLAGHFLLCLGLGVFSSAIVVIGFTAIKELFPIQIAGTATGLVNLFPFAGGALAQPLVGYILERHSKIGGAFTLAGYRQAFFFLWLCSLIALIASFFLKETLVKPKTR
jgi:sugar phosphate permease